MKRLFVLILAALVCLQIAQSQVHSIAIVLDRSIARLHGRDWHGALDSAFSAGLLWREARPEQLDSTVLARWSGWMRMARNRGEVALLLADLSEKLPDSAALKVFLQIEASGHYFGENNFPKALEHLQRASILLEKHHSANRWLQIERLLRHATLDGQARKWPLAQARADTALALLPAEQPNRVFWESRITSLRAKCFFNQKQENQAAALVSEAIRLLHSAEAAPPDIYEMEALSANLLRMLGQDQAASDLREKTDVWLRSLPPFYQASLRPQLLNSLGIDLKNAGRFSDAQRRYEEGLRLFDPQAAISPRTEADLETNLGVVLLRKGRLDEALLRMNRGLDIVVRVFGPESEEAARRYNNLANNYYFNGDYGQARFLAEKGLGIMRKLNQPFASRPGFYITLLNVAYSENDTAATAHWLADFGADIKASPKDFPPLMQVSYVNLKAQFLKNQGSPGEALQLLDTFLRQNTPPADRFWVSTWVDSYALLASIKHQLGYTEDAIKVMKTAQGHTFFEKNGQIYFQSADNYQQTSLLIAEYYLNLFSKNPEATALLDSADLYQNLAFKSIHEKAMFFLAARFEQNLPFTGPALSTFIWNAHKFKLFAGRNDWLKRAADLVEAASVQNLRDFLRKNPGLALNNLPETTREAETDLQLKITEVENAAFDALNKADGDLNAPAYLAKTQTLLRLHHQHDSLVGEIARQNPELHNLQFALPAFGVDSLQQKMLRNGQCYLQFFHQPDSRRLDAFLIRPDTMAYFYVHVNPNFKGMLEKFRLQVRLADFGGDAGDFAQIARQLGDSLLGKAAPLLAPEVIIAPDAYLAGLSFESLLLAAPDNLARPHRWRFAGLEFAMSYTTSASLLRRQQTRRASRTATSDFVGFAPFFEGDSTLLAGLENVLSGMDTTERRALQPLPFSGPEVAELVKIMGGEGIFGREASKNRFLERAPEARILHLATHGQANRASGDFSFLTFASAERSESPELLFANELYNLSLVADLVTLSACESGLGRFSRGQGIVGFSRALACAGARSLLASQWRVNDRSTAILMALFYKSLKQGKPKNVALLEARRAFASRHKKEAAPFFWAGFALSGDVGQR